jgi:arylsulfatase
VRRPIALACILAAFTIGETFAQEKKPAAAKPNILVIMGDDIGWFNPSIYHRGIMSYETPNIDRIGKEGAMFTD